MRQAAGLALLFSALALSPAHAKKKPRPVPSATKIAIEAVLDGRGEAVAQCLQDHAAARGLRHAEVHVHLMINNRGQLFDCQVKTETDRGENPELAACVEKALRAATYPSSPAPMVTAERSWVYGK